MRSAFSPKEVARAIGVSESSLRRWADEGKLNVSRTAGGHRRIALADAIRFIRESGSPLVEPQALGLEELRHAEAGQDLPGPAQVDEALYHALSHGHLAEARGLVLNLYLRGQSMAELCDGPLRTVMHRLGELWEHSRSGIALEHAATDTCIQTLNQFRNLLPVPAPGSPVAVGAAPPDDPYALPSLMCATVLSDMGFHTVNLGPNTPLDVLAGAGEQFRARLVWLSLSAPMHESRARPALAELAERIGACGAQLVVGGRRARPAMLLREDHVIHIGSMGELAAFARGMVAKAPAETS
jgi:excisionase family DNA binding protein